MILNFDIPKSSSALSQNGSMSLLFRFEKIFWLDFGCGLRWRRRQSVPATAKQYFRLNKQNVRCHNLAGWW